MSTCVGIDASQYECSPECESAHAGKYQRCNACSHILANWLKGRDAVAVQCVALS